MKKIIAKVRLFINLVKIVNGGDFLLITRDKERWHVANTFPADQISRSGKAIYMI